MTGVLIDFISRKLDQIRVEDGLPRFKLANLDSGNLAKQNPSSKYQNKKIKIKQ